MSETFTFDLISPERTVVSARARFATVPGEAGEFRVLPGHMPLLSALRPGVVSVELEGEAAPRRMFVAGGFADVTPGRCVVLAEESIPVETLDFAAIEKTLQTLEEDRTHARDDMERRRIEGQIAIEAARAQAAERS